MPTDRLPRQVLLSQLPEGQRPHGSPRLQIHNQQNLRKGILIPTRGDLWNYSDMYGGTQQSSTGNEVLLISQCHNPKRAQIGLRNF